MIAHVSIQGVACYRYREMALVRCRQPPLYEGRCTSSGSLSRGFSFSFLYIKKVGRKRFIVARTRDCAATRADESLYARKEADAQRSAILVCSDANWSSSSAILLSFALAVSSNVHLTFCVFVSSGIVGIGVSILLFFRQYFSWFLIRIEGLMLG